MDYAAGEIAALSRAGARLGVVVGGGNILRGASGEAAFLPRVLADEMGMLATVINGLAFAEALRRAGVPAAVFTALPAGRTARPYGVEECRACLEAGEVAVLAGGTGNPFFTTDTAAALRAAELGAEVLFKGTKVDGVYDRDPSREGGARRLARLTPEEYLGAGYGVLDQAAVQLCRERGIPLVVFDFFRPGNLLRAARGEAVGSLIAGGAGAPRRQAGGRKDGR